MKRLHFTRCRTSLLAVLLAFSVAFVPVPSISDTSSNSAALLTTAQAAKKNTKNSFSLNEVPKYNGKASVVVHGNQPYFTSREKQNTKSFESYHKLDKLGRCGVAYANISIDTMPTEKRGEIGQIRPSGWHTVKYSGVVDGNYLYNRCHLIAYCLTAENANKKNLITGTRYLNNEGMLPYETKTAQYIDKTKNHVLYRVTPVFKGSDLVASGVLMEAYSVEDQGKGISFCVYCYNVQPGVAIDYATGDSHLRGKNNQNSHKSSAKEHASAVYILNTNTKKFHKPVKMKAASLCGSDLKYIYYEHTDKTGGARYDDVIAGHEPSGQVVQVGEDVLDFKEGDRVVVYHIQGCGYCDECKKGFFINCQNPERRAYGWQRDGALAEYMVADVSTCIHLPDFLTYEDGAMIACGFGTAYQGLLRANVSGRDRVLVMGLGPVGQAALILAKTRKVISG